MSYPPIGFPEDNGKPIRVHYPMTQEIWDKVVRGGGSANEGVVTEEHADRFTMEYPTRASFESELARFDGSVEYRELPDESSDHAK